MAAPTEGSDPQCDSANRCRAWIADTTGDGGHVSVLLLLLLTEPGSKPRPGQRGCNHDGEHGDQTGGGREGGQSG